MPSKTLTYTCPNHNCEHALGELRFTSGIAFKNGKCIAPATVAFIRLITEDPADEAPERIRTSTARSDRNLELRKRQLYKPPEEQLFVDTGPEAWRRHATERRTLHCLQFELDTEQYCSFVCWPFRPEPERSCAKLLDSRITWLTARAGDTVMTRHADSTEWTKERIKVVTLYRVHPVRYNDLTVTCALDWLEGVPALHRDALGVYAEGIPCDERGYIPTRETRAFDLLWPYEQPTHRYDGYKTEYGVQWESNWPAFRDEAIRLTENAMDRMEANSRKAK